MSIRTVKTAIRSALEDGSAKNFITSREMKKVIKTAEKGPVTLGEAGELSALELKAQWSYYDDKMFGQPVDLDRPTLSTKAGALLHDWVRRNGGGTSGILHQSEIEAVSKVGGAGIRGKGTLRGTLQITDQGSYLITAKKGTRSEVRFQLSLPRGGGVLAGFNGQTVSIAGFIDKTSPFSGSIAYPSKVG